MKVSQRINHRLRRRAARQQIERADQISWSLLIFALIRAVAWLVLIGCVAGGLVGVPWLHWASTLGGLVVFITLISLYANAEGEFAQAAGYWAAIRAGRAHAQGVESEGASTSGHAETLARIESLTELVHDHQLRSERD